MPSSSASSSAGRKLNTLSFPFAFEAIAVALQHDDLGVVDEPVDHGSDCDRIPKISAHAKKDLFELSTSDERS
jgi:hypothetical protein